MKTNFLNAIGIYLLLLLTIYTPNAYGQAAPPEPICQLKGTISAEGEPLPFATITIINTTLGAASDLDGVFELGHIPEGDHVVKVQAIGYKPKEKAIRFEIGKTSNITFDLESDVLGLEQVVVTADRKETKRTDASVIVNTVTPKLLQNSESISIGEGLNYVPGLRLENNCQNCGFTQVRMNGMDGAHSQVLINNRAIFSNLAGVYGLELMPASMIERIEVIRGGGSALYGSNAVAGTINLITKDPISNSYDISTQYSSIGVGTGDATASDYSANMNATIVSEDKKTGLALFGFMRSRDPYDANNDSYSEISAIDNLTLGARLNHRIDYRSKITLDFIRMNEERRGGDKFEYPKHEANIAEAVDHKITTTALTYERFVGTGSMWSVYGSTQNVDRASYYGAEQSLADYGQTDGLTYNIGSQFKSDFGDNSIITGIEAVNDILEDNKLGYYDIETGEHIPNTLITDQKKSVYGVFAQYDRKLGKVKVSLGARFDRYEITDLEQKEGNNSGNVFSPRMNVLWDIVPELQWRASYSQGYRAPQVFDEDLHIETSGSRKVVHANDANLKQETSHSYMTSLDFNKQFGTWNIGLLAEGFYTKLSDAFASTPEYDETTGVTTYIRSNDENGATVKGVNFEATLSPINKIYFKAGFTKQTSTFGSAQELGEKDFLRTPNDYGFFSFDYDVIPNLCLIATGTYTGKMKIAYYGNNFTEDDNLIVEDDVEGAIRTTPSFFDLGLKAEYQIKIGGLPFKFFGGVKNIFNSYQSDFDNGVDRDPAYVYGPMNPRTVYFGIKLSNIL